MVLVAATFSLNATLKEKEARPPQASSDFTPTVFFTRARELTAG